MYIQYMLCPKQEFITEPAKPKMNPMFLLYVFCHSMKSIENNRGPTAHTFPMRDRPSGQKLLLLIPVLSTMHCLHEKQLVDAQHRVVWHPTFRIPQIGLDVRILRYGES